MIGTIAITSGLGTQKPHGRQQEGQEHPQLAGSPSILQRLKSINFYTHRSQEPTTAFEQNPESDTHYAFKQTHEEEQARLTRSPSMLQRLKSINLYNYLSQESNLPHSPTATTATGLYKDQESDTHYNFQQPQEEAEEEYEEEEQAQLQDPDQEQDQYDEQTLDEIYSQLQDTRVSRTKSDTKPASGEVPTKLPRKLKKSASSKSAFAHFEEDEIVQARRPATVREGKVGVTEVDDEVDSKADDFINKFKQQLKLQRMDSIMRYKEIINRGSGK